MKTKYKKLSKMESQEIQIERNKKNEWWLKINKGNIVFAVLNIVFAVIAMASIILSILDKKYYWICWNANSIGVLCQIVTAIVSFITSTIGIAITLQREECWGISIKEFNNLRVEWHYPIVLFIILAITFSATNVAFYIFNMMLASIGIAIVALVFCSYVTCCEIPLMIRSEKFLSKVVKKKLLKEWKSPQDLPKNLKTVLKHLIIDEKNLSETYLLLKSNNEQFNRYLILKLLELQSDAAFELKQIESKQQLTQNADRIYENIRDLLSFDFDLSNILGEQFLSCDHYITRVVFRLKDISEYENRITSLIASSLVYLKYDRSNDDNFSQQKVNFILTIVTTIVALSIRNGDFGFVKALQKEFSIRYYELGKDNYESLVFALVSMQFYFLCNDSENASAELKEKIMLYLDYSDTINHMDVYSWKNLFANFAHNFEINFQQFMQYFSICEYNWDVPLYFKAQWVKLDRGYALRWYLVHLLNSFQVQNYDYSSLCLDEQCKHYLKDFGNLCFDKNKKFIITDEAKSILKFYDMDENPFQYFLALEERSHRLFNFINKLRKDDLFSLCNRAVNKGNQDIADLFKETVSSAIKYEWGFDSSIEINSSPKSMVLLIEKESRAINYIDVMNQTLIRSIFHEIKTNAKPKYIMRGENFDKDIATIFDENFIYASQSVDRLGYFIKDTAIKQQFEILCTKVIKFKSDILAGYTFVKDNGFKFNLEFSEFIGRDLTVEELSEEVESYKSADGQYVYEGTFLSREEIEHLIAKNYAVLKISMRYNVQTFDDAIFEIKLF